MIEINGILAMIIRAEKAGSEINLLEMIKKNSSGKDQDQNCCIFWRFSPDTTVVTSQAQESKFQLWKVIL